MWQPTFSDPLEQVIVAVLPASQPAFGLFASGVALDKGQQLDEQAPAAGFKGRGGAFQALQEADADEDDDLLEATAIEVGSFALAFAGLPIRRSTSAGR